MQVRGLSIPSLSTKSSFHVNRREVVRISLSCPLIVIRNYTTTKLSLATTIIFLLFFFCYLVLSLWRRDSHISSATRILWFLKLFTTILERQYNTRRQSSELLIVTNRDKITLWMTKTMQNYVWWCYLWMKVIPDKIIRYLGLICVTDSCGETALKDWGWGWRFMPKTLAPNGVTNPPFYASRHTRPASGGSMKD